MMTDLFRGIKHKLDFRIKAVDQYESRVVSKIRVLDIGGRNSSSKSRKIINELNKNPNNTIVCTDILAEYKPDIVDDITNTSIKPASFDGIYCDAILEHVTEYWKAVDNIYSILTWGGEAFIYVPFCFQFHDNMDYHRFTFTEVARMLERFREVKIFTPGVNSGYGYVIWSVLTLGQIHKFPRVHTLLTVACNRILNTALYFAYKMKPRRYSFRQVSFYYTYLLLNTDFPLG